MINITKVLLIIAIMIIALTVGINIFWWDLWDKNILITNEAKRDNCVQQLEHIQHNQDSDLINLENYGADSNTFKMSDTCFKLINNFDFVNYYDLKISHISRVFFSVFVYSIIFMFVIELFMVAYNLDDGE